IEEDFANEDLLPAEEMGMVAAASDPGNMKETYLEPEKTTTITSSTYGIYYFSLKDLEPSADNLYVFSVFSEVPTIGSLYRVEKAPTGEVLSRNLLYGVDANKVFVGEERTTLSTNYHFPSDVVASWDYAFVVEKADSDANSTADVFFSIKPLQEGVVIEQRRLTPELVWSATCLAPAVPNNLLRIRLGIEGSGDVPSYDLLSNPAPWIGLYNNIEEVALNQVTGVGDNAFDSLPRLTSVILPTTLKKLGYKAFYSKFLREVMYAGTIGKLANMCPLNGGNLIDGLYRVFHPTAPWGKEVFAYIPAEPTQKMNLYNENTELGKVMYFDFMLSDIGFAPGEYVITFRANGHVEGSIQWRDTSDPGQEAPHYPIIKSVNNLDHEVTSEEVLGLSVNLEEGRKYRIMLNACFAQSSGTKDIEGFFNIAPKSSHNLVVEDHSYTLTAKSKKQTIDLQATAKGNLILYKSDNAKVKVSKAGVITIPKNFVGKAVITVTAEEAPGYDKESLEVTVLVTPAGVELKKVTSPKA
ncbi:MAG: hypothetical protein IIZ39_02505, partial [Blautia sp.]|nr:hypothetical protein [Blautia sp.]